MPNPMAPHKTGRHEVRSMNAFDLWMDGNSFAEIGRQMGISRNAARERVLKGRRMLESDVEEKRDAISFDLAEIMVAMKRQSLPHDTVVDGEPMGVDGDPAAANAFKGLAERFSKLHGLDAPVKTDVTSDGDKITINVKQDWQQG